MPANENENENIQYPINSTPCIHPSIHPTINQSKSHGTKWGRRHDTRVEAHEVLSSHDMCMFEGDTLVAIGRVTIFFRNPMAHVSDLWIRAQYKGAAMARNCSCGCAAWQRVTA
jgi:hypothetical protein